MTQTTIPSPQKPWGTSIAQRLTTAAILALAAVLAGAAVEFTGLVESWDLQQHTFSLQAF